MILKLTENTDEISLELVKKNIQNEKLINEKEWLIRKIDQIKKS